MCATVYSSERDSAARTFKFSIAAQPLQSALDVFAKQTGVQLLYDSETAAKLHSPGVQGQLPMVQALNKLLVGTNLVARMSGEHSVTLLDPNDEEVVTLDMLRVEAPMPIGRNREWEDYSRRVQAAVAAALKNKQALEFAEFRSALRLWIDARGVIERVEFSDAATGHKDDLTQALRGLQLSTPPPLGMPQPLRIRVNAQAID